jgi:ABC-type branched-subunit amino acid transport system substrate-binding protein
VLTRAVANLEAIGSLKLDGCEVWIYWQHLQFASSDEDFVFPSALAIDGLLLFLDATNDPGFSAYLAYEAYERDMLQVVVERTATAEEAPGPNSLFLEPSIVTQTQAFTDLMRKFGWSQLSLFYDSQPANVLSAQVFREEAVRLGGTILDEERIDIKSSNTLYFIESRLKITKYAGGRAVFIFANQVITAQLLLAADENGIGGTGFAWVSSAEGIRGAANIGRLSNSDVATFRFGLLKTGLVGLANDDFDLLVDNPAYYYRKVVQIVVQSLQKGAQGGRSVRAFLQSNIDNGDFPLQFGPEGFRIVGKTLLNMVEFSLSPVGHWSTGVISLDSQPIVWPGGGHQVPNDLVSLLQLAVLYPATDYKGNILSVGQSIAKGVALGLKTANKSFKNLAISAIYLNTAQSDILAAANIRSIANTNILGLLGPFTSTLVPNYLSAIQMLLDVKPLISYAASAANFSDPLATPFFLRTVQPDGMQATALALFIDFSKWQRVAVIYSKDDYGLGLYTSFVSNAKQLNIAIDNPEKARELDPDVDGELTAGAIRSIEAAIQGLIETQARVVVYLGTWRLGAELVLRGSRKQLTGGLYVWMGPMWLSTEILTTLKQVYSPDDYEELIAALEGCFALGNTGPQGSNGQQFIDSFKAEYNNELPSVYAMLAFDTVTLFTQTISNMASRGEDYYSGKELLEALRNSAVVGASGPINFSPGTNDRSAYGFTVLNFQSGSLVTIYTYEPLSGTTFIPAVAAVRWAGSDKPEDSFDVYYCPFPEHMVVTSSTGLAVVITLGFGLFLLTLALSLFSYSKWKMVQITLIQSHVKKTWRDSLVELTICIEFLQLLALAPKFAAVQMVLKDLSNLVMLDVMSVSNVSKSKGETSGYWTELVVISVLCYLWFLTVVLIALNVDKYLKAVPGLFRVFTAATGIYLPLVGNSLFLPFLTLLLDAFVCDHEVHGQAFVFRDCYMSCWTSEHNGYIAIAAIAVFLFEPLAVFSRPMWQQSKLGLNLMLKPLFLLFKTCIQILLIAVGKSLQGTSPLAHGVVFTILMLAYCLVAIRVVPFNYHRCNLWEIATLLAVLYFSLIATCSNTYNPTHLGWFIGLLVGWGIIIIIGIAVQLKKFPSHFREKGQFRARPLVAVLAGRTLNLRADLQPEADDLNVIQSSEGLESPVPSPTPEEKPETERSDLELRPPQKEESSVQD